MEKREYCTKYHVLSTMYQVQSTKYKVRIRTSTGILPVAGRFQKEVMNSKE